MYFGKITLLPWALLLISAGCVMESHRVQEHTVTGETMRSFELCEEPQGNNQIHSTENVSDQQCHKGQALDELEKEESLDTSIKAVDDFFGVLGDILD